MEVMDSIGGDIADPDADEVSYDGTPLAAAAHDDHGREGCGNG